MDFALPGDASCQLEGVFYEVGSVSDVCVTEHWQFSPITSELHLEMLFTLTRSTSFKLDLPVQTTCHVIEHLSVSTARHPRLSSVCCILEHVCLARKRHSSTPAELTVHVAGSSAASLVD